MASNDILKRTPFGGFKREDVINYIEGLQRELAESRNRAAAAEQAADDLRRRAAQCPRLEEELRREKERTAALQAEKEAAAAKADAYLRKVAECDKQLAALQEKLHTLEESCAGITDSEKQINGLVLDAVMYSDKIISKAKDAAKAVSRDARDVISATAQDIESIGSEIGRISTDFSDTVTRLSAKLSVLSGNISELNARFDTEESEEDDGQFRLGEDGLLLLDEIYMQRVQKAEQERKNG